MSHEHSVKTWCNTLQWAVASIQWPDLTPAHTYLIFVISFTQAGFLNPKFYTQKMIKNTQNTKNIPEKVYFMQFLRSIWKILVFLCVCNHFLGVKFGI